jgi:hypothetical protein
VKEKIFEKLKDENIVEIDSYNSELYVAISTYDENNNMNNK